MSTKISEPHNFNDANTIKSLSDTLSQLKKDLQSEANKDCKPWKISIIIDKKG